ncbi:MAG: TraR/DksA family transcriptional regulator [Endomicrobiaceae bacterium]|nr:TraR/DksA family transcriptional regulator [Endomicrobiaceae bacterium]
MKKLNKNKVAKRKPVKKATPKKAVKKQAVKIKKISKKVSKKKIIKKVMPKKTVKKQTVKTKKSDGKVSKKKTAKKETLTQKDLNQIKKFLVEKKVSIMNKLNSRKLAETDTEIGDEADTASQNNEREMQFELDEISSMTIKDIDNALTKLNAGSFGLCECCGCNISIKRLQAMPWGRYCIECQTEAEKNSCK